MIENNISTKEKTPMQKRTRRSKIQIEQDLSSAITKIIITQGFTKLTINNVSEEAHVIKRVIYENYETFENLLKIYFAKNDFWTSLILSNIAGKYSNYRDFFPEVLKEFYRSIDENAIFQCIIRWEIAAPNEFIKSRAKNREDSCHDELERNKKFFQKIGLDIEALYALLIAGIYHLVLRKNVSTFCNIDFSKREGKERLFKILDKITELVFAAFDRAEEKKQIAIRLWNKGMSIQDITEILEVNEAFVASVAKTDKEL